MKVTERQRELMVDYLAFLRQSVHFSQSWARWKRIHNALMRSATYDYRLFRIEAELWEELQEDMEVLRQHRAGKQYVEGRN